MDLQSALPILVIGGCGFTGGYVIQDLLKNYGIPPSQIHVLDLVIADKNRVTGLVYHQCDITDRTAVEKTVTAIKPCVVFHLASPKPFSHDLPFFLKVNVDGSRNLVEAAQSAGVKAFVYTSSSSVVHDAVSDLNNVDETAPVLFMPQQREAYHHSKAMAETLVLEANNKAPSHMLTVSIRPSGIFGYGDVTALKPIIDNAKSGKYKFQIGDGTNLFDWTYVENVARGIILGAEGLLRALPDPTAIEPSMKVDGEAFFITNDQPVPFWDFVRDVGAAAGYPTPKDKITVIPKSAGLALGSVVEWGTSLASFGTKKASFTYRGTKYSTLVRTFNIDKAKRRLGYKPLFTIEEGIKRSVAAT